MLIERLDEQTVALRDLDLLCCELLHQIAISAEPGDSEAARARLFSSPSGGREPELDAAWKEYVEPGLAQLFRSALDVVRGDLQDFPAADPAEDYSLLIPVKHLESWIHALNQARLAITARYDFTDQEMEDKVPLEGDGRAFALFQVFFYGVLQEWFLAELD